MDDLAASSEDESSSATGIFVSALILMADLWQRQRILNQTSELLSRCQRILSARRIKGKKTAAKYEGRRYCLPAPQISHDGLIAVPQLGVSQAAFSRICALLDMHGDGGKDHGWPDKLEVAVFLHWLVSGSSLRMIASRFGMPKSTVADSIQRTLTRLLHVLQRVVRLPTDEEVSNIGRGFHRMAGGHLAFRLAIGCLDTMDIRVGPPSRSACDDGSADADVYLNADGIRTVRCQVMCDHRGLFRDIFAGYPGMFPDQQLLLHSPLYALAGFPPGDTFLIAGPNYECTASPVAVVTPYEEPVSCFQVRFNVCHWAARSAVRWAFCRIKSRWPRVFDPDFGASSCLSPKIIVACAMLHNVCTVADGEEVPPSAEFVQHLDGEDTAPPSEWAKELKPRLDHVTSSEIYTPAPRDHLYM